MSENLFLRTHDKLVVLKEDMTFSHVIPGPASMPGDLVPGEFISLPSGSNNQWYVWADKQRFWNGSALQVSGTLMPFDPNGMTYQQMYQLRRKVLANFGWN